MSNKTTTTMVKIPIGISERKEDLLINKRTGRAYTWADLIERGIEAVEDQQGIDGIGYVVGENIYDLGVFHLLKQRMRDDVTQPERPLINFVASLCRYFSDQKEIESIGETDGYKQEFLNAYGAIIDGIGCCITSDSDGRYRLKASLEDMRIGRIDERCKL